MVDRVENFTAQEIRFLDSTITIRGHSSPSQLPADFVPSSWSVLCGRGKAALSSTGNLRLKVLIQTKLPLYAAAQNKMEKTLIVSGIVDTVRSAAQEGAFVKLDNRTKRYIEIGDAAAREKVGQLFREMLAQQDPEKIQKRKDARKARALKKKLARGSSTGSASSDVSVSTSETSALSSDNESITSEPQK